jgi:DNA-directed RNA polymerase subunit beta'
LKSKNPIIKIVDKKGVVLKQYDIPVYSRIVVAEGDAIKAGDVIVKIPRAVGKSGDITGGLPPVTELFEARNPSDPAVVAEIDGVVSFGSKLKRGNREVIITSKTGEEKKYLISTSKQILAQENDYVKSGTSLSEGAGKGVDIFIESFGTISGSITH